MVFPTRIWADRGEVAAARVAYNTQHGAFFGPDGVARNLGPDATEADALAAFHTTMQPPAEVADSWLLLLIWAFWCLWTEYPLPMAAGCAFGFLYFTATFYYEILRPALLYLFG